MKTATFDTTLLPDGHLDCPEEYAHRERARFRVVVTYEEPETAAGDKADPTGESKWAALARRYREKPNLRGSSEKLNALVREFREGFSF